jgi:Na+/proline symporter
MQWLSYVATIMVGVIAVIAILNPPKFLQDLIVFSTEGIAACFFIPVVLCLYWPRMNSSGTIAGMMMGGFIHLTLFIIGYINTNQFQPYALFGLNPVVWDLLGSATATIAVSLLTARPEQRLVQKFFRRDTVEQ